MKRFEYLTILVVSLTDKKLNELGQDGWELIILLPGRSPLNEYIFKREFIPVVSVGKSDGT